MLFGILMEQVRLIKMCFIETTYSKVWIGKYNSDKSIQNGLTKEDVYHTFFII